MAQKRRLPSPRGESPRSRRRVVGLVAGAVALLAAGLYLRASVWWSPTIQAQVVDARTGAPLMGTVVVATWDLVGLEGFPVRQLAVQETATDSGGRLVLNALGSQIQPRGRPHAR